MKQSAPAALRNRAPIADVLAQELPSVGTVLEVASGTGEHVVYFAQRFPNIHWQPSDPDEQARASIAAWVNAEGAQNIAKPIALNAADAWPDMHIDAILCINMVHISPWAASEGLMASAGRLLATDAPLILYGPYLEPHIPTSRSNHDFDASLKLRNPEWGLRPVGAMDRLAERNGLARMQRVAMPANNLMLVYRKKS